MTAENRRDVRYRIRIDASIVSGKHATPATTEDVSFRGVFLKTSQPPKLRQLVTLKFEIPSTNEVVSVHGMAVHVTSVGVGVQFFAADEKERSRWERFVRDVRDGRIGSKAPDAKIRLWVKSLEQLRQIHADNISKGGLLLPTDVPFKPGAKITITVVHPVTKEGLPLEGTVKKAVVRDNFKGIAVALTGGADPQRDAFFLRRPA